MLHLFAELYDELVSGVVRIGGNRTDSLHPSGVFVCHIQCLDHIQEAGKVAGRIFQDIVDRCVQCKALGLGE